MALSIFELKKVAFSAARTNNAIVLLPHSLHGLPPYSIRICGHCACLQLSCQPCCIAFLVRRSEREVGGNIDTV